MNSGKVFLLFLAIFIILSLGTLPFPTIRAQAAIPQIASNQPIYAIWNLGGNVSFTATRLTINSTYYVWDQRPNDPSTRYAGITFASRTGTANFQIKVTPQDPAGTYLVSLSNSPSLDSRTAVAHFGVVGIERVSYRRTDTVKFAGGGYVPNSTVTVLLIAAGGQAAGNISIKVDPNGNLNSSYRLPPSTPTGSLTVSVSGSSFDAHTPVRSNSSATIARAPLTIIQLSQPTPIVERTATAAMSLKITYPDGSPVTTSTANSTRVFLVNEANASAVIGLQMVLTNSSSGVWSASWVPPFSQKLVSFHFKSSPSDFDDSYGNVGSGATLASSSFQVTPAHTRFAIQSNATLQRTLPVNVVITPTYHDGTPFMNVTRTFGTVTVANGTAVRLPLNGTPTGFFGQYKTNSSTPLGPLRVTANITDVFGNTADGNLTVQIVPALLDFHSAPITAERTTLLNVTTLITYPDGSNIDSTKLPSGFNVTITKGNFTWTTPMVYNPITNYWISSTGYRLSQNQTLGDYGISMNATDPYGNGGNYSGTATVIPAFFQILISPSSVKVNPHTLVNIVANVLYPNGSALTPDVAGVVIASTTNSSGTFTYPMVYNATDGTWLLPYTAPDPGLRFGVTLTFSLSATDEFGNAGSAADAFTLNVGAGAQTLILATIVGALPPIALIGWAIATVSTRRRKHKP